MSSSTMDDDDRRAAEGTGQGVGQSILATPRLEPGTLVDDRYEILEFLGEGGFATVYKARHVHIQRMVALKLLDTTKVPRNGEFDARFVREAQTAAQIDHPNVVTIHDFGFTGPKRQPYIAMELLDGHDLDQEFERHGALEARRVLRLFASCLEALGEAHQRGIVHKDLKPSNLFISHPGTEREALLILDFGVASINQTGSKRLTSTGQILGTPQYLAPEYIQKQLALPAFDVYQMGLILVEALTGRPVIESDNPFTCLMAHCQGSFEIPDCLLGSALGPVIERALRIDHTKRFQDASEFRAALLKVDADALTALSGADMAASSRIAQSAVASEAQVRASLEGEPTPDSAPRVALGSGEIDSQDLDVVLSSAIDNPSVRASMSSIAALEPISPPRAGSRPLLWLALAALALGAGAAAWFFLAGGDGSQDEGSTPAASAAEPAAPPQDAAPTPPTDPGSPPATDPVETAAAVAEPPTPVPPQEPVLEPPAVAAEVKLFLITEPGGARVFDGERELFLTPDVLAVPQGDAPLTLRFELDGYVSAEHVVVPSEDRTVRLELERRRSTSSTSSARRDERKRRDPSPPPDDGSTTDTATPGDTGTASNNDSKAVKIAP